MAPTNVLREDVVVASELEFWRQNPATKAAGTVREVERLARRPAAIAWWNSAAARIAARLAS
jgi:hypothetical protein